jgi:hypothetical protein
MDNVNDKNKSSPLRGAQKLVWARSKQARGWVHGTHTCNHQPEPPVDQKSTTSVVFILFLFLVHPS